VRIIRGELKSRRFSLPKNFPSRPTTDFAKEGLFNMLENRISLDELEILDLCSGTGNISFEFLSREAGRVIAVDRDYNCVKFIQKIATDFNVIKNLEVVKMDILQFLNKTNKTFDLIFSDPPYDVKFHKEIADLVFSRNLLKEDGVLIIEHSKYTKMETVDNFEMVRSYGNVCFSFFQN